MNTLDDAVGTFDSNLPKEEDGELDLSGLSDSDLMDMLSGDQDLSDLGIIDVESNVSENRIPLPCR